MAFKDIIILRLIVFCQVYVGDLSMKLAEESKLNGFPLSLDENTIKGPFRMSLNRDNTIGFSDVLETQIAQGDLDATTKIGGLAGKIVTNCSNDIKKAGAYKAKMMERVRIGLRDIVASLTTPPIDPNVIVPTADIESYLGKMSDAKRQALLTGVQHAFGKYVLSLVDPAIFSGKLLDIQAAIVDCMMDKPAPSDNA